ncbi:hypothetical protein OAH18_00250 [bacterium]|nr:hypothetical protein [bacterium]
MGWEFGLQTWTVRDALASKPGETLALCDGFAFMELAGTGPMSCSELANQCSGLGVNKVRGAHLCDVGTSVEDVVELAIQYLEAFPGIQWFAFFWNPEDIDEIRAAAERSEVYSRYNAALASYKTALATACAEKCRECPALVYHTYTPDFWHGPNGGPAYEYLTSCDGIQLDTYFALLAGFDLGRWLESASGSSPIHSIHVSGITKEGRHAVLPFPSDDSDAAADFLNLLKGAKRSGAGSLIVEHEIDPAQVDSAMMSLKHLQQYTGFDKSPHFKRAVIFEHIQDKDA